MGTKFQPGMLVHQKVNDKKHIYYLTDADSVSVVLATGLQTSEDMYVLLLGGLGHTNYRGNGYRVSSESFEAVSVTHAINVSGVIDYVDEKFDMLEKLIHNPELVRDWGFTKELCVNEGTFGGADHLSEHTIAHIGDDLIGTDFYRLLNLCN